ncbi:hypothetical protein [Nostoc sp. C117]|uniref:hypothetical protein n=1 Tax=Nostoc sp. C117 TaxID=3349875 RepID=UPI00370D7662
MSNLWWLTSSGLAMTTGFQILFYLLFLATAIQRFANRRVNVTPHIQAMQVPNKQWLVAIPVLNESHMLQSCIEQVLLAVRPPSSIIVALDGKNTVAVSTCQAEVLSTLQHWRSLQIHKIKSELSHLITDLPKAIRVSLHQSLTATEINWSKIEEVLVTAMIEADNEEVASSIESCWRCICPVQSISTSLTVQEYSSRRKAEALNLLLSLSGKRCIWLRFESKEFIAIASNIKQLRQQCHKLQKEYGVPVEQRIVSIPCPDYFYCVDVDEKIEPLAFSKLQSIAEAEADTILVQSIKQDFPVSGSLFSYAFQAHYAASFHWEAGWLDTRSQPVIGCSYFGSMASIRLSPNLLEKQNIKLLGGQLLDGWKLFPEGYGIEDYALYCDKLIYLKTRLLDFSVGKGEAPRNVGALFAMWSRWTKANVRIFLHQTLKKLLSLTQSTLSFNGRLVLFYHGMSWFTYANVALITSFMTLQLLVEPTLDSWFLAVMPTLVLAFEIFRRIIPVPNVKFWQAIVRLPVEYLMFPIAAYFVMAGAVAPYINLGSPPVSTPRNNNFSVLPLWVLTCYFIHGSWLLYGSSIALNILSQHPYTPAGCLAGTMIAYFIWFVSGLCVLCYDHLRITWTLNKKIGSVVHKVQLALTVD